MKHKRREVKVSLRSLKSYAMGCYARLRLQAPPLNKC